MDVGTLKPTELAVLDRLADFRFLTADQLMHLGVSKSKRHLYATLKAMATRQKPLVAKLDFGVAPTLGRLALIYHLTARGAELLGDAGRDPDTIRVPKRVRLFAKEYFHRIACVEFHIAVAGWLACHGGALDHYVSYYEHGSKGSTGRFTPATTVTWPGGQLTADALFLFRGPDGAARLCAFELHRGRDAMRLMRQFEAYVAGIRHEAIETAWNYSEAVRVLLVFEEAKTLVRFVERASGVPLEADTAGRFFLNTLERVRADFRLGWVPLHTAGRSEPTGPLFAS